MDDTTLIVAVARGDDTALRELFSRHAPWLAARLRSVLPAADVEDVLQETFLAVWRGAAGYRPEGQVGAWIWGIARRQAMLFLRRRGPAALALLTAAEAGLAGTGAALTGEALTRAGLAGDPMDVAVSRADLADAVATLGPEGSPDRRVWQLMYVEDRPVAEVAGLMGVPEGTVKSRAHRVRRLMRTALRPPLRDGGGR
jgi:RNA polymerase sigma-70 factor, ECF subfamily